MSENYLIFAKISQASILIPCFLALFRFKTLTSEQRLIAMLVWISSITEIAARIKIDFYEDPNTIPLYHVYVIVSFIVINKIFRLVLASKLELLVIDLSLFMFLVFAIMNTILWQPLSQLNSNAIVVSNLTYILYAVLYFRSSLSSDQSLNINKNPIFWFNTGVLLYNSGAFFLFLILYNYLGDNRELLTAGLTLNQLFNLLLNGFYSKSLIIQARR